MAELLLMVGAGSLYLIAYILTYLIDPNPQKTKKEGLGSYQLNEIKAAGRQCACFALGCFKGVARWTFQTLA